MRAPDTAIIRRCSAFRFLSDEHFAMLEPLLQEEHYDFAVPRSHWPRPAVAAFRDLLGREAVRQALAARGFAPQ